MNPRLKKFLLLLLAAGLLAGAGLVQGSLTRDRGRLGLTRVDAPLSNAPPVLAFTTVALGGFRGLISNMLWIRASDLQEQDRFFEMAQLADWITKLEPHFSQVWVHQAWNMSYNISVKFKDYPDRWRWVQHGIELLRDDGLRFNPNDVLIHRELAWHFQHKLGANTDDASMYYKQQWANAMAEVFTKKTPNLDELVNPRSDDERQRAALLRNTYKMDPAFMKEVDERYGPLEWRLPEAHAIYWAAQGLKQAKLNPSKVKQEDLIMLRRVIYQSMLMSFHRGRLVPNAFVKAFEFGPNLDIVPKVSAAYEEAMNEDAENRDHISKAHRNLLRDAVYFLHAHNRVTEAAKWYKYLATKYPDKPIIDNKPDSLPGKTSLQEYTFARLQEDLGDISHDRIRSAIEGLLINSYTSLVIDEDERAAGFKLMARQVWERFMKEIPPERQSALGLIPFEEIDKLVRDQLLDPERGWPLEMRLVLRTRLGLPAEPPPKTESAARP